METSEERKKQVLEHLALTSNNMNFGRKPPKLEYRPPTVQERSARVKEHVGRTINISSLSTEQRKSKILDHVSQSLK